MTGNRIIELAAMIGRDTDTVNDFCQRNQIPTPSYHIDCPPTVHVPHNEPIVSAARDSIIAATRELSHLMQGPSICIGPYIGFFDAFAFNVISRFGVARYVPIDGDISFEALSEECNLEVSALRRILRFAMTNGVFSEHRVGHVSHTSLSRALVESEQNQGCQAFTFDEAFAAASRATDALQRYPDSEEPTQSGWGLANTAGKPLFEELHARYPDRARNATLAMDVWNSYIPAEPLVENWQWQTVRTVVDIGGAHGHVSQSLAQRFPNLTLVVQDLRSVITHGAATLPAEYRDRISFMEHDMFQRQPVENADVYLFRCVFHDWPDRYCIKILKALVPALKPGARVIINDACMPPPGTLPPTANRDKRMWDVNLMVMFNARDREDHEWASLFTRADQRFKFQGVRLPDEHMRGTPPAFLLSIIEAVWEP